MSINILTLKVNLINILNTSYLFGVRKLKITHLKILKYTILLIVISCSHQVV